MHDQRDRTRKLPHETTWGPPLLAGLLALAAGTVVAWCIHDAPTVAEHHLHPGVALLSLPAGAVAMGAALVLAWARHRRRTGLALAAAVPTLVAVVLLFICAAWASRQAQACITPRCDSPPFHTLSNGAMAAQMMLVLALLATGLVVLNAADAFWAKRHPQER